MKKLINKENKVTGIIIAILVILSITFFMYGFVSEKKNKIACVDTEKVLKGFKSIEDLNKSMEQRNLLYKSQQDTLISEFQKALSELDRNRANLSKAQVQETEQKLRQKQEEYERFTASSQENLKKEEYKIIEKTISIINQKISLFAKTKGYSMVLGKTPQGNILFSDSYYDVTDEVIDFINK